MDNIYCVSLPGPTLEEVKSQMQCNADVFELRCDLYDFDVEAHFHELKDLCKTPFLLTHRLKETQIEKITALAQLQPEYFDMEWDLPSTLFEHIIAQYPQVKIIASCHLDASADLYLIKGRIRQLSCLPAFYKKIVIPKIGVPVLGALSELKDHFSDSWIVIEMGEEGQMSRLLWPKQTSGWMFCAPDQHQKVVPGQLSIDELKAYLPERPCKEWLGLIGNPVRYSISHNTHNQWLKQHDLEATYLKFFLQKAHLGAWLEKAKDFPFRGLSVTTPFKEEILSYLDQIDDKAQKISAVNTLVLQNRQWVGYNTDGYAAVECVKEKMNLKNSRWIVLGAGGTARAIICEAVHAGVKDIVIGNRTLERARELAHTFGVRCCPWNELEKEISLGCDVFVQATSIGFEETQDSFSTCYGFSSDIFHSDTLLLEVVNRPTTPLVEMAAKRQMKIILGKELFLKQASYQFKLWYPNL